MIDAIVESNGVGVGAASGAAVDPQTISTSGAPAGAGVSPFPNSIDGILTIAAQLVVSGLTIPTALTDIDQQQVLRVMKIANVFGVVNIHFWAALCGVPNTEHPWGERIANGIIHWAAEYFRKAPQGYWLQGAHIQYGWFLLPENWSHHNSQLPPAPNDRFLYPCVYIKMWGGTYMICIHLLIVLARMWSVHPDRLSEWWHSA